MARRTPISIAQKKALRAHKALNPDLGNLQIKDWFEAQFQQVISTSSVSEILSSRYNHLDQQSTLRVNQKRYRPESWPTLESALFEWMQRSEADIYISGEILRKKAQFFWKNLHEYKDKNMPSFSNGWLQKFQHRQGIKDQLHHGEKGSASTEAAKEMIDIRQALSTYDPKDIFNCDESGLFWKMTPNQSLSTRSIPGRKKEKARISILFCCNSTGTERLPMWIIGNTKKPRAFHAAGIRIENLGIYWRSNKKAWMTGSIMEEWLQWFDSKMQGRKVVLLMDNFSAHESAVELIKSSNSQLQNTLVIWLPPNLTSLYQPLDQGIINIWKTYYKKRWINHILEEYEAGRDPYSSINVLKAIRWAILAWEDELSVSMIINCFKKALLTDPGPLIPQHLVVSEISQQFERLREVPAMQDLMDIQDFLNPAEEAVFDDPKDLDEHIIALFEPASDDSDTGEVEVIPKIPISEALEALKKLRIYQEQQEDGNIGLIRELNREERAILVRKAEVSKQQDIRGFFSS